MNVKGPWNIYRTRFLVRACQLTEPLIFTDSLGREHSGHPGDYLVETSPGILRITTRELFEDIYVPLATASLTPAVSRVQERTAPTGLGRPGTRLSAEDHLRASA